MGCGLLPCHWRSSRGRSAPISGSVSSFRSRDCWSRTTSMLCCFRSRWVLLIAVFFRKSDERCCWPVTADDTAVEIRRDGFNRRYQIFDLRKLLLPTEPRWVSAFIVAAVEAGICCLPASSLPRWRWVFSIVAAGWRMLLDGLGIAVGRRRMLLDGSGRTDWGADNDATEARLGADGVGDGGDRCRCRETRCE
ncbi:hypothetical protein ACLOJK_004836 [Asimina triloba]